MTSGILLDTCVVFFSNDGGGLNDAAVKAIESAALENALYICPITAWEIGMVMSKGRQKSVLTPSQLLAKFNDDMNCQYSELSPETLIQSSYLPASPHGDPADRIIIASARALNLTLITRDRAILAYGAEGHVKTLAC
jgi:PIN domain nuclease of toxin-antitoxin system